MAEEAFEPGRFELRIEGASVQPGKVAVRDLAKLGPILQMALERTARVARNEPGQAPGPVPREIYEATNLLLIGIEPGSANLLLELPLPEEPELEEGLFTLLPRDLGLRAMDTFVRGLHELEEGQTEVPQGWDNSVMEVAENLADFATDRQVVIDVTASAAGKQPRRARVSPASAERFRVRHAPIRQARTARGRLFLVDLKAGRLDVEDDKGQRVQCQFPGHMEARVKRLVGEIVVVSGEEEFDATLGRRGKVDLTDLQPAGEAIHLPDGVGDFWQNRSAAEQVREQGIRPISSVADFASDFLDEDELERFTQAIREGRREE